MERELKIVISVFLVYFIFGLSTFFTTGSFVTFFFLGKPTLLSVALAFWIMNLKTEKAWVLLLYTMAVTCLALNDEHTIGLADQFLGLDFFNQLANSVVFLVSSLACFFAFLFFSVIFYYRSTQGISGTIILAINLLSLVCLLFTRFTIAAEVLGHLFFLVYFVLVQRDSDLKNKTLRILSYQYLLLVLLESFEYFV